MTGKENRPALKQLQQSTPPSRSRKERPCDGCRRRKSKCVPQDSGRCVLCEFHKQECTFVEKAQPRKRKVDDGDGTATTVSATATSNSAPAETQARQQLSALERPSSEQRAEAIRRPYAVDESLSLQRHRHCKLLGQTTALDASLIGLGTFNDKNETECRLGTLRQVSHGEYFSMHADADVPLPDDEVRALAEIEQVIGPHDKALIDIYFRNVHPSYPIIQKRAFMDRHRHGDRQFNPPLLAAMYLLALSWWERDPVLSKHPKPDMARLEYIAISALTVAMHRPKISAVQAGLLLLQRAKSSTWTLTVQLVALGQDIGLHLDCSAWSIPLWERRLRKILALALYMQDKWSALMHGRPSHINSADWAVPPLTMQDFDDTIELLPTPDEDAPDLELGQGRSLFMQMVTLTSIMAQVCETFYSQTAKAEYLQAGKYATQLVLNRAKPVQLKLKEWFARLPPECRMDYHPTTSPSSPHRSPHEHLNPTASLHLAYFATEISIHRRIVSSLCPNPSLLNSIDGASVPSVVDPYLLSICRSAAKTRLISAMDFINRLQPAHLHAFWFFPSATNFSLIGTFGALLQATSPGREEAGFYACRLREFRWTLGVSAKKAGWIQGAVEGLEGCWDLLTGLGEKPSAIGNGVGEEEKAGDGESQDTQDESMEVDLGVGEVMEIDGFAVGEYD